VRACRDPKDDEYLKLAADGCAQFSVTRGIQRLAGPIVRRARAMLLSASASQGWLDPLANPWRTSLRKA
jgi:hypothetical protein